MSLSSYSIDGPPPPDMSHLSPIFLTLHLVGGHVGLPILIATCLLSKGALRHPTLINFFCSWVIYSISFCLTLYTGKATDASLLLCQTQSALIHGAITLCATSGLMAVLHIGSMFWEPDLAQRLSSTSWTFLKIIFPYTVFLVFAILTIALQSRYPTFVNASNGLYCTFYKDSLRRFGSTTYYVVVIILILGIDIAIAIRYFYMWRKVSSVFPLANRTVSPVLVVRLMLFNIYCIISLGAGVALVSYKLQTWSFMIEAGLPLVIVLVFGTSKDLFLTWCFWKKKRKPEQRGTPNESLGSAELLVRTPEPSLTADV